MLGTKALTTSIGVCIGVFTLHIFGVPNHTLAWAAAIGFPLALIFNMLTGETETDDRDD